MRTHFALLLCATLSAPAQDIPFVTEYEESTNGSRSLHLHGSFTDADSVYVELFHNGKELVGEPRYNTWDYTLSEFDYYVFRFTDGLGREKILIISELSDDLHESIAMLVIDFRRQCNLILRKSSNGRPDFMLEETGCDRER